MFYPYHHLGSCRVDLRFKGRCAWVIWKYYTILYKELKYPQILLSVIGPGINPLWIPRNNLYPYISTYLSACLSVYLSTIYSFCFSGGLWLIQSPIRLLPLLVDILIRPYVMEWCNYLLHVHWRNMKPLEIKKQRNNTTSQILNSTSLYCLASPMFLASWLWLQ